MREIAAARAFARCRTGQDHHAAGVTSHRLDGNRTVRNSCGVTGSTRQEPLKRGIPAFWPGDRLRRKARARHPSKGGMLSTWPDEAADGLHQLRGTPLTQNTTLPSPALLQRHLHGVHYPATKAQLLAHARGECERVIGTLALLPEEQYSRPTDVSKAFGELAQEILKGASYPASRDDLVAYARDQDASLPVIEALLRIPDQDYDDSDAVIIEIIEV